VIFHEDGTLERAPLQQEGESLLVLVTYDESIKRYDLSMRKGQGGTL
jgi:hypothetical protein